MSHLTSSKQPPPEEDAREWLLFDIDDEDPTTANFLKPATSSPLPPVPSTVNALAKSIDQTDLSNLP
jgi:hypothetical protein